MLLVPVRKTRQLTHTWVTVKGGHVTRMLARHVRWLRSLSPRPKHLFPARKRSGKKSWSPNPTNHMSTSSLLRLIRRALREVCGLSAAQAKRFTVYPFGSVVSITTGAWGCR